MTKIKNSIAEILSRDTKSKEERCKRISKPKKSYFDLHARRKREQRKNIREFFNDNCSSMHEYLKDRGLCIENVALKKVEADWSPEAITYKYNEKTDADIEQAKKTRAKIVSVSRRVNYFSDVTYDRFKRSAEHPDFPLDFPSSRKTKKICEEATKEARFEKIQRNNYGYYVPAETKIRRVIEENWKILSDRIKNKTIRVKLCGDGTNVATNKLFNFCFTLPDLGNVAKTAAGNYTLGLFDIDAEKYTTLRECLSELNRNLRHFKANSNITIQGELYTIKFFLGGDMSFLHKAMGLNSCNSNNPCFLCKVRADEFYKTATELRTEEKRTLPDLFDKLQSGNDLQGYKNEPIFDYIEFEDLMFDTLHLLLRVTGKLFELLIHDLNVIETANASVKPKPASYLDRFFSFLRQLGINEPAVYERDNKLPKLARINGDQCLEALRTIDFNRMFPAEAFPEFKRNLNDTTMIHRMFYKIFIKIKDNYYIGKIDELIDDTESWRQAFLKVYQDKDFTPYMHLLVSHMGFYVERHGDVDIFNIQGLEKLNDHTSTEYFRASNKQRFYVGQMLTRRFLREYSAQHLEENKSDRTKRIRKRQTAIKKEIQQIESTQNWCQYIIHDHKIDTQEIDSLSQNAELSVNLLCASLNLLKSDHTYFMKPEISTQILNNQLTEIECDHFAHFKNIVSVAAYENIMYLIFIQMDAKKVVVFAPTSANDHVQILFLENWNRLIEIKTGDKNKYQKGHFTLTLEKSKTTSNAQQLPAVVLLIVFKEILHSREKWKFDLDSVQEFKRALNLKMREHTSDFSHFCSRCSKSCQESEKLVECQCTRRYHLGCLDSRITRLYNYNNFVCFFCHKYYKSR